MKKRKRFSMFLAALIAATMLIGTTTAYASEPSNSITGEQAQKIAVTHIQSSLMLSENEVSDSWHWGMTISEPTAMYDLLGNVSSYYFLLSDENGDETGYIIIGANSSYAPVIEYATSGSFYPAEALEIENATTIHYTGGIDYLISDGETYFDVSSFGEAVEATEEVAQNASAYSMDDFSDEWEMWENILAAPVPASNPPTSGGAITKPDNYETGYQTKDAKNITGYGLTYKTMNDFDASDHCAPTAATNIMYYWYNRSSSTYGKLRKDGDSTWKATFNRFHSLMGTTDGSGTPNANLKAAYTTYYKDAGFSPSVTYYSSASWSNMETEIDNNYPFHMIVQGHYYYGNHSIVGIGYEEYKHSTFSYSRYIRVVDGWTSSTGRFVHTSVGSSQVRMVKVRPS